MQRRENFTDKDIRGARIVIVEAKGEYMVREIKLPKKIRVLPSSHVECKLLDKNIIEIGENLVPKGLTIEANSHVLDGSFKVLYLNNSEFLKLIGRVVNVNIRMKSCILY